MAKSANQDLKCNGLNRPPDPGWADQPPPVILSGLKWFMISKISKESLWIEIF